MESKWLMYVLFTLFLLEGLWCQGCWDEERTSLLQLKTFFIKSWHLRNWERGEQNSDCCQWEGVECNSATGRVITLNLNYSSYKELDRDWYPLHSLMEWENVYLNASLFLTFVELKSLHLAGYGMAGCIENEGFERLSKLRNLEILDLGYNMLNNSILSSLTELSSLKSLYLVGNKFEASNHADGFEKLFKLRNLEILDLNDNMLNNCILSSLSELPSLKSLYLAANKFEASDYADGFERLSKLRNLEILDLSYNMLNNSILSSLSELPSLKSLYLANNKFQASNHGNVEMVNVCATYTLLIGRAVVPTVLGLRENCSPPTQTFLQFYILSKKLGFLKLSKRLSNLEILNLQGNFFTNSILPYLSELLSLKYLNLADNNLQASNRVEADLEKLSRLDHLEVLDLGGVNFSYNILSSLASLPSLKLLFLKSGTIRMNPSTRDFHNLSKVEGIFLEYSVLPTNFFRDIGALTSLKRLSLFNCGLSDSLTSPGLCELTHLLELDVGSNYLGGALPSCLANLTSLKSLSLDSNNFSGDIALSPLNKLTSLYNLSISDNHFQIPISFRPFFNHSKLKHIYAKNNEFYVDTNTESLEPTFQLNTLVLSGYGDCGGIPNFLHSQHDLEHLDLSHLNLTGEFPIWLLENNTRLHTLLLANNSLSGPIGFPSHFDHMNLEVLDISKNFFEGHIQMEIKTSLPSLRNLNISRNSLTGSISPSIGDMKLYYLDLSRNSLIGSIPPSIGDMKLYYLDLSRNSLTGSIPPSIGDMKLYHLDLSHNNLSGGIPDELTMGCSSLSVLVLSNNNLQGHIFSEKFSLFQLEELQLDGNHFSGSIPKGLSNCSSLSSIDFSNNNLSGKIPSWMGNLSYLREIIMPNNGLEGPIPIDFCQLQSLEILDLSNNNISGSLPACFKPMEINHVHLSKNRLEGSLITQFCNSFSLITLDLSDNQLSGNIPDCINMLGELSYLILKNNNLIGEIPIQLCKLQKLSLIDLSQNHLSGYIPSCLNITTFDEASKVDPSTAQVVAQPPGGPISTDEPVYFTTKSVSYSYKGKLLTYMSGIDFSCNKLTGEIPNEIGHLNKIHVLNLSHNFLVGQIPTTFSNLEQIESLDLSYNNLSGKIPPQLVKLHYLSIFSVAYNNLSGKTPAWVKQFATFNKNCYQGNPLLCGEPMRSCSAASPPPLIQGGPTQGREDDGSIDMGVFYVSLAVSYIMVLMTIAAVLYINPYWRRAWFYYTEMCFISCYYFMVDHLPKQFH
ncbi:hypothetical protein SLEP1_g52188 [Rubroshorea leprosula]|uniref:Leucine-rich repeat-containing N-terminal plant-type domain-containing protein n=1 Tax=Rubroshorea leprosula TaxID=152421 RepID=A0AAV5M851_9ROSI|nr:hypothetical protein SLEP1_g52188 [Rubroshorea leprosula]